MNTATDVAAALDADALYRELQHWRARIARLYAMALLFRRKAVEAENEYREWLERTQEEIEA